MTEGPRLLDPLLDGLDAAYQALPGEDRRGLGAHERLRAERLARLPGPWSLGRLRHGLRAALCQTEAERAAFDRVWADLIAADEAELRRAHRGDGAGLRAPPTQAPEPRPSPPPVPSATARRGPHPWRWAVAAGLALLALAAVWGLWPRPQVEPATSELPTRAPEPEPEESPRPAADPLAPWDHDRVPVAPVFAIEREQTGMPPGQIAALVLGALCLLGLGGLLWWVEQEDLPPPAPEPFDGHDHLPLVLDAAEGPRVEERRLPAEAADRIADAVGPALDPAGPTALDVPASVRATADAAGFPTEVLRPPATPRELVIVRAAGRDRPVDLQLARALALRGLACRHLRWRGELLWPAQGAPVSVERLTERDAAAVVLLVGEAAALERPPQTLQPWGAFPRVAWIELRDRNLWAGPERAVAARLPLFGADAEGWEALAGWLRGAGRPRWSAGPGRPEAPSGLDEAARLASERLLGEALPLAACFAMSELPATERAMWALRDALLKVSDGALRAALGRLPPTTWDRLSNLPGAGRVGEALELDATLCTWLRGHFQALPDKIRTATLDFWLARLGEAPAPAGSQRAVERQVGLVWLEAWRAAPQARLSEAEASAIAAGLRAAAAGRWGRRVKRQREAGQLPALPLDGLSRRTAWLLRDGLRGERPPRWTRARAAAAAALAVVGIGLAGAGATSAMWRPAAPDQVAIDASGIDMPIVLAWSYEHKELVLAARVGPVTYTVPGATPDALLQPGVVLRIRPEPDATRRPLCRDDDRYGDWTVLRCASDGRLAPRAEDTGRRAVFIADQGDLEDPSTRRFLDLLLASGGVEIGLIAPEGRAPAVARTVALQEWSATHDSDAWLRGKEGPFEVLREHLPARPTDVLEVLTPIDRRLAVASHHLSLLTGVRVTLKTTARGAGSKLSESPAPLPASKATFTCRDGAGRALACEWRARWEGLPETGGPDLWDLEWTDQPPVNLALGEWTVEARAPGCGWQAQSVTIVEGEAITIANTCGEAMAEVELPPMEGVTARLDGREWDGKRKELSAGRHVLELSAGCGAETRTALRVGSPAQRGEIALPVATGAPIVLAGVQIPTPRQPVVTIAPGALKGQTLSLRVIIGADILSRSAIELGVVAVSTGLTLTLPPTTGCGSDLLRVEARDDAGALVATAEGTLEVTPETPPALELELKPTTPDPPPSATCGPATGGPTGARHTALAGTSAPIPFIGLSAGSFCMGSPEGEGSYDEHPQRRVSVSGFLVGKSEVTQAQWRAAVVAGKAAGHAEAAELDENPSLFKGETRPVERVSWCDAVRFANLLSRLDGRRPVYTIGPDCEQGGEPSLDPAADGYRLPTEAEWEYAARAGTSGRWSFGEDEGRLCTYGNVADLSAKRSWDAAFYAPCDDGYAETAPACSLKPNQWGLCDVHGNVWEWAGDWYADAYDPADLADPAGPPAGTLRVIRGGSFNGRPDYTRTADRSRDAPTSTRYDLGFRLVVSAASPSGGP